jgi:class 3 adenylate cyclase/pimeloyl-ACP methyl ester carboxylesterase
MSSKPDIRFCATRDGVDLAYAVSGSGPPLVKAANWLSHLDFDQESPVWRHYIDAFSSRFSYLRYDERGSGLSDWDVPTLTFEDWITDLEAVVDAAGLDRFPLLGISQGGAVAIEYAVRHPERVSHLILYGAYARGRIHRGERGKQEWELHRQLIEIGWGTDQRAFRNVFTKTFIPGGSPTQHEWFDELMRRSTSTENALRFQETFAHIDVVHRAPLVRTPTLILHATGDQRVPFEEGRKLASLVPHASLIPLESDNHILLEHEPAWHRFLAEVTDFVLGSDGDATHRTQRTLLMTDIVGSTRLIEAIGDDSWVDVLSWHDRTIRAEVDRHHGTEIDHTGDGFLVSFLSPPDAVRCAISIQRTLEAHRKTAGFAPRVRIGIHAGQVAYQDQAPRGRQVHLTARITDAADSDQILASADLAAAARGIAEVGAPRSFEAKGIEHRIETVEVHWH